MPVPYPSNYRIFHFLLIYFIDFKIAIFQRTQFSNDFSIFVFCPFRMISIFVFLSVSNAINLSAIYQKQWIAPRKRIFTIFHVICWCTPALLCMAIIILNWQLPRESMQFTGSTTGGWCWMNKWYWDLLGGKVIEIPSYLFLITVYVLTWKQLRRRHCATNSDPEHIPDLKANSSTTDSSSRTHHGHHHPYHHHHHHPPNRSQRSRSTKSAVSMRTVSLVRASRAEDMRRQLRDRQKPVGRLLFIPIIFVFLRIWGTSHMFMTIWGTDSDTVIWEHQWQNTLAQILLFMQALCTLIC